MVTMEDTILEGRIKKIDDMLSIYVVNGKTKLPDYQEWIDTLLDRRFALRSK